MKKVLVMVALVMVSVIVYAFNDRVEAKQGKKEVTGNNGEVVVMNKEMFLKDVFDYEKSKEWKYKGDKRLGVKRQSQGIGGQQSTEYPGDGLGEITDHRDTSLIPQIKFFFFISYGCIVEQRRIRSVYQGLPGSQQNLGEEKCRESGGERIT